jgi:hypothetical protein
VEFALLPDPLLITPLSTTCANARTTWATRIIDSAVHAAKSSREHRGTSVQPYSARNFPAARAKLAILLDLETPSSRWSIAGTIFGHHLFSNLLRKHNQRYADRTDNHKRTGKGRSRLLARRKTSFVPSHLPRYAFEYVLHHHELASKS